MYVFTEICRLQSWVRECSFATSGPHTTNTIKCSVRGQALETYWSRHPEQSCEIPWTQIPRVSNSSRTTSSGIFLPRFLISRLHNDPRGEIRCENSPLLSSRWPWLWSIQRFVGQASASPPLIGTGSQLWHETRIHVRATRVRDPWDLDGGLVLPLVCGSDCLWGHLHVGRGAMRHATQKPSHVSERRASQRILSWLKDSCCYYVKDVSIHSSYVCNINQML